MWRRVEGPPEPWESSAFLFTDEERQKALSEAVDYGSPSPEHVNSIWSEKVLKEGNYFPGNVQDRVLGGVRTNFQLW